jgi:hypothetical protein
MNCWRVIDDVEVVTQWFIDDPKWKDMDGELADAMMNKYFAIKEIYDLQFEKLWKNFEEVCKEYHRNRKIAGIDREQQLMEMFDDEY